MGTRKSESVLRWGVLFMACLMMIANYYCYDIPAALHQQLKDYMGSPDNFESSFSLLYTLYSVPNVILPFFGGYFVDYWGVVYTLYIFSIFLCVGQVTFALGVSTKSWPLMFLGRVLYGIGGESLGVASSAVLSYWFQGKELAFSFGLNLSVARLGSVMNNFLSPLIAREVSIGFALWFGAILTGASLLCVFMISYLERLFADADSASEATRKGGEVLPNEELKTPLLHDDGPPSGESMVTSDEIEGTKAEHVTLVSKAGGTLLDQSKEIDRGDADSEEEGERSIPKFREVLSFNSAFWLLAISCVVVYGCVLPFNNIASGLLLERNYFQAPEQECHLVYPKQCQNDTNVPVDCPLYYQSDTNQPPLPQGLSADSIDCTEDEYSAGCASVYCARLEDAEAKAGAVMSIPYIISATLSPFLGALVDKVGMRAVMAALAPATLIIVHCLLALTHVDPIGPLVGQGLAYAGFAAVLWPSVPLVVQQHLVGLAFGLVTSIQNCGLAIFPVIISAIYEGNDDLYIPSVEYFFIALAIVGFVIGLYLNFYDYTCDSKLNTP